MASDLYGQVFGDDDGHFTINQAQRMAKEAVVAGKSAQSILFEIVGPSGRLTCRWLDPYLGFFRVDGKDGFMRAVDFEMYHNLHVENFTIEEVAESEASG